MSALCLRFLRAAAALAGAAAALIIPLPLCRACLSPAAPPVQRRTLPSGIRVIVAEQPGTTLAALDLRVRVGSGAETTETNGAAHFIEHLVFKGTESRQPGEIDQVIETLGGELTAQTTRDATRFAVTLPAATWKDALAVIADMTLRPAFRPADVAAEKTVILSEMAVARTEPARAGFNTLTTLAFDTADPYRLPLLGGEANVRAITAESLQKFWQRWYRPRNMTLVIAGSVKAADVFAEAERLFPGSGTDTEEPVLEKPVYASPVSGARTTLRDTGEQNLATIFVGFRAPSSMETDALAAVGGLVSLLADRADQGNGQGRLPESLVKQQSLALAVTADYVAQRGQSLVVLSVTGTLANAAKLEKALLTELKNLLVCGFTEGDAKQARQNLVSAQAPDSTAAGMASRLALADVLGLSAGETDDPALYATRLRRVVTPESLTAAARRYLAPSRGFIVVLEPPPLVAPEP